MKSTYSNMDIEGLVIVQTRIHELRSDIPSKVEINIKLLSILHPARKEKL